MKRLNVGVIGCGTISGVHFDAIVDSEQARICAVCDVVEDKVLSVAERFDVPYFTDYNAMLNAVPLDVIHVLLPHDLHGSVTLELLALDKHIVLEKPVGITMNELGKIEGQARKYKKTVGVTLQNRFNPTTEKMKALIDEGSLGNLIAATGSVAWYRDDAYYNTSDWRGFNKRAGGGLLINQAIHTLDLMAYLGGGVTSVQGSMGNYNHPEVDVEDTAHAVMHFKSGGIGNFFGTNNHGTNSQVSLEMVFEYGILQLRDQQVFMTQNDKSTLIASDLPSTGEKQYWGLGHKRCIEDIYSAIIEGSPMRVTLNDGLAATELVLGIYESSRHNYAYQMRH